mgnify:CR=1 FL=1
MKIFTHTYSVVIFDGNKFCWKNNGWVKKTITDLQKESRNSSVFIMMAIVLLAIVI